MERCVKCGKEIRSFSRTAYGENRCLDCFDDYLMTDRGKVEYLIGICNGDYLMEEFDADFLGHVAVCWQKYRAQLNLSIAEVNQMEAKARAMGIL